MGRVPIRLCAFTLLVLLAAAQAHVGMETGSARASGHACQMCVCGAFAIVPVAPELSFALAVLRLEVEPPRVAPTSQQTEVSAPRAPPCA